MLPRPQTAEDFFIFPNKQTHLLPVAIDSKPALKIKADKKTRQTPLFRLDEIDLTIRKQSASQIEEYNPHRYSMSQLDWIVWENDDKTRGVGLKEVRDNEFWVQGHFPKKPIFPGMLMVEAGAQLACYLTNVRTKSEDTPAILRIDQASFRSIVVPGDDIYILCQQVRKRNRFFTYDIQGWVKDTIAFETRIMGSMVLKK